MYIYINWLCNGIHFCNGFRISIFILHIRAWDPLVSESSPINLAIWIHWDRQFSRVIWPYLRQTKSVGTRKKTKSCQTLISKHVEVPSSVSFQPQICDRRNIPNNVYGHNWSNRVKTCQNHPKPRIEWNNNNFVKTWISSYFFRLHTHVWQGSGGCFDQHRTGFHHPNPRRSKIGQKAWPSTSKNIEMARFECMQVW
jgi:hypothetical protein